MKACYINGASCISAQPTFDSEFLEAAIVNIKDTVIYAQQPSYKEIIPPAASRRMAKGVKMGIYTSQKALAEAGLEIPEAIIVGTGMGCMEDSEKFLQAIIDNQEQFLTPTSFIQSTHNTVGGQIALGLKCKGYNFTYVNGAVSFESTLLDAGMQIGLDDVPSILIGGVDETAQHTLSIYQLDEIIKKEEDAPFDILHPNSKAVVFSEGAAFFVLENQPSSSSYAQMQDIALMSKMDADEVPRFIQSFLEKNNITPDAIDAIVLGNNGDIQFDHYYTAAKNSFSETPQVYYKHLSGEYPTASAFGFWVAANIIKRQEIPQIVSMNKVFRTAFNNILLYNQYRGKDHSLILLKNVQA